MSRHSTCLQISISNVGRATINHPKNNFFFFDTINHQSIWVVYGITNINIPWKYHCCIPICHYITWYHHMISSLYHHYITWYHHYITIISLLYHYYITVPTKFLKPSALRRASPLRRFLRLPWRRAVATGCWALLRRALRRPALRPIRTCHAAGGAPHFLRAPKRSLHSPSFTTGEYLFLMFSSGPCGGIHQGALWKSLRYGHNNQPLGQSIVVPNSQYLSCIWSTAFSNIFNITLIGPNIQ